MSLESTLYSTMTADLGITTLVSTRIYPLRAPQPVTRPYITYQRITTNPVSSLNGNMYTVKATIQIDAWADSYATARDIYDAVKAYLMSDPAGIAAALLIDSRDFYEQETRLYRASLDASIIYHEV